MPSADLVQTEALGALGRCVFFPNGTPKNTVWPTTPRMPGDAIEGLDDEQLLDH